MGQTVTVILPTFNRSRFLPAAFAAIHAQQMTSWELIVIDDGSTDDTQQVVTALSRSMTQPVRYLRQDNQGAYGARNTGLQAAQGEYIAFYDSDDLWLPHHLSTCVAALERHADVDWVYAACELVDLDTQRVIRKHSFYDRGRPRPFMRLAHDVRGPLRVITDSDAIRCQIRHGLYCGLQNSVLRRHVFDHMRFATDLRNEAEDQLFAIRAIAAGFRLAYVNDVHVRYHVHSENSSGAAKGGSAEKHRRVFEPLIRGYERLATELSLTASERRALRRRIGRDLFWSLGYAGYWAVGERRQALEIFARALRAWPWDPFQWKTYTAAIVRSSFGDGRRVGRTEHTGLIMRVLYLTMNPNRESTTVPTEGWFRILRTQGLEPVLVSNKTGAFQAWAGEQGVPCYEVPLPFPDRRWPLPFLTSLARVVWIARRHGIQLVHCNEQDIYPIGQYAARLLRVPVVVSVHFTMRNGFSEWAFRGRRGADRVLFISQGSLAACRPGIDRVIPESRRRVLYNGLDLDRFHPDADFRAAFRREHGLNDRLVVGVACALRPRKQLEHLFEAAAAVRVPDLRVVVAGGAVAGDERYAEQLLERGRQLLGDRLIHVGHLRDLRPFYNGLDVFVNTSREEACSISVIEALACGCPVVGYPSTSVDEQILPSGGEIVRQDDVAALSTTMEAWATAPDRLERARIGARQRAATFNIETLAEQLWHEYGSVLGESKR